jgi:hypothetical protein
LIKGITLVKSLGEAEVVWSRDKGTGFLVLSIIPVKCLSAALYILITTPNIGRIKMAGQEINDIKLSTILKILAFLCGIALIAIGITNFSTFSITDPVEFFLSIYYILFGILVCLSELPFQKILFFFSFLKTFFGKAVFLLFLGTLIFDYAVWWHILVAICLWCVAICYFFLGCACKSKLREPEEKKSAQNDDSKAEEKDSFKGADQGLVPRPQDQGVALQPLSRLVMQPAPLQAPVLPPPPPKD